MRLIRTGHGLWSQLVKRAGLDLRRYDKDVATDFRRNLKLAEKGSIVERLRERKIRPEPVLGGFFHSIQPFTQMFRDILHIVERAGKSEGKENLLVEFDFAEGGKLKLDLENFRQQVERFNTVIRPLITERWNTSRLWSLAQALGDYVRQSHDAGVRSWAEEYHGGHWPDEDIEPPQFDDPEMNELIGRIWQLRRATIEAARDFSPNPADLSQIRGRTSEDLTIENGVPALSEGSMQTIAYLHSDHWAVSIAAQAYARAAEARTDPLLTERIKQRLRATLDDPPPERRDIEEAIQEIEELLNLPIWKHRYELYSVWVLTQIIRALGGPTRFKFELEGSAFHIPFSPKLLATLQSSEPPVRLWSEVRYKLSSAGGKGRIGGMQPDYTITTDTGEPPTEAFGLIECKQYLRSSARNFRAALIDYATGQPGADVMLVNYGPVGPAVLKGIPSRLMPRIRAIGNFRPQQPESERAFDEWVQALVERHTNPVEEPATADQPAKEEEPAASLGADFARIELRWGATPRDLDLCLLVLTSADNRETINFMRKGTLEAWPFAQLEGDVTTGSGPEVINIRQALPGLYRIAVRRYSDDGTLAGSNASLTLYMNGKGARRFTCPATGEGIWWHVCDVDFLASLVTEVNRISHSAV